MPVVRVPVDGCQHLRSVILGQGLSAYWNDEKRLCAGITFQQRSRLQAAELDIALVLELSYLLSD